MLAEPGKRHIAGTHPADLRGKNDPRKRARLASEGAVPADAILQQHERVQPHSCTAPEAGGGGLVSHEEQPSVDITTPSEFNSAEWRVGPGGSTVQPGPPRDLGHKPGARPRPPPAQRRPPGPRTTSVPNLGSDAVARDMHESAGGRSDVVEGSGGSGAQENGADGDSQDTVDLSDDDWAPSWSGRSSGGTGRHTTKGTGARPGGSGSGRASGSEGEGTSEDVDIVGGGLEAGPGEEEPAEGAGEAGAALPGWLEKRLQVRGPFPLL